MNIIVHGCNGRMGKTLTKVALAEADVQILCGIDTTFDSNERITGFPVYEKLGDQEVKADVVIDFSHPSALKPLLGWCILHHTPLVVATTGLGPEEYRVLQEASQWIPVFQTANLSLGINVLCHLLELASTALSHSFDVEVIEQHHKGKKDAPSGTTYLLLDAIGHHCPTHSIRAGNIPGEHTILFAGPDEVLELRHTAYSPEIFARGAIAAARYVAGKPPGLFHMSDLISFRE